MRAIEYILGQLISVTLIAKTISPIMAIVFMLSNYFISGRAVLESIGYGLLTAVVIYVMAHILYTAFTALYLMTPSGKLVKDVFTDSMNNS